MSALAVGDADGVPPLERPAAADPTVAVDGYVVLSGVVLILVALAFAFVMHHFLAAVRGRRGGPAARTSSAASSGGVDDAAASKGAGGGGVDPVVLRALPVTAYRRAEAEAAAARLECAVCIAEVEDGEAARFLPGCGHGFHAECVDLWLRSRSTCPLCRVAVADDDASKPAATLPPAQPEPANYYAAATTTALPTNVLFWGTHGGAVTTTTTSVAEHGHTNDTSSSSSSGGGDAAVVVIEVPDTATTAPAPAKPRGGGRERMVGSLRRMWSS